MSKILDWIKKHVWQTILIGFGLFFAPLFLVHVAYKIPAISPWFASTWEAGELITYIAGFEAFLGTVGLGAVAIHQNDEAIIINSKLLLLEKRSSVFERKPDVDLSDFKIRALSRDELFHFNNTFYVQPSFPSRNIEELYDVISNYYLISFNLENKSAYTIEVGMESLRMLDIHSEIEYYNIPFPYGAEFIAITSKDTTIISVVVDDQILQSHSLVNAILQLTIRNFAGDQYNIRSTFFVWSNDCDCKPLETANLHFLGFSMTPDDG